MAVVELKTSAQSKTNEGNKSELKVQVKKYPQLYIRREEGSNDDIETMAEVIKIALADELSRVDVTCLRNGAEVRLRMRPKFAHPREQWWGSIAEIKLERLYPRYKEAREKNDEKTLFWVHQEAMPSTELITFIRRPEIQHDYMDGLAAKARWWLSKHPEGHLTPTLTKELANIERGHQLWLSDEMKQFAHRVYGSAAEYNREYMMYLDGLKVKSANYIRRDLLPYLNAEEQVKLEECVKASLLVHPNSGCTWIHDSDLEAKLQSLDWIKAIYTTREFLQTFAPAEYLTLTQPISWKQYTCEVLKIDPQVLDKVKDRETTRLHMLYGQEEKKAEVKVDAKPASWSTRRRVRRQRLQEHM